MIDLCACLICQTFLFERNILCRKLCRNLRIERERRCRGQNQASVRPESFGVERRELRNFARTDYDSKATGLFAVDELATLLLYQALHRR